MKIKKLNESMLPSQATLDDCLDDYRQNAFGFAGVEDYVDTNYPMHPQEFKAAVCDYLKNHKNESLKEGASDKALDESSEGVEKSSITKTFVFKPDEWVGGWKNLDDNFGEDKLTFTPSPHDRNTDREVKVEVSGPKDAFNGFKSKFSNIFESLEEAWQVGDQVTIKWNEPNFEPYAYATCEYQGQTVDGKHKFKSTTYGWDFIVDLENKKIKTPHDKEYDLWDDSGWTKNALEENESKSIKESIDYTIEYYLNNAGRERRPTTVDDSEDYITDVFEASDDYDAIIYAISVTDGDDEDEIKENYPTLDDAIQYLTTGKDWSDGSPFVVKLSRGDKIIYDSGENRETMFINEANKVAYGNEKYKGYMIRQDRKYGGYNVYDKEDEMEDSGFKTIDAAKEFIDSLEESKSIKESADDLKGYNVIKKGNIFRITDDNDVELDIDFESEDSAKEYINTIDKKDLEESANSMIYLFPELTDEDLEMAKGYGLKYLGKNNGADGSEDNWVLRGAESSLRMFADKYLGYELHPDYLYDEEDFAGDIINESLMGLELDKDDILDWLAEHEQAWADAERYFDDGSMDPTYDVDSPLDEVSVKELVGWIADHKQLYDDFHRFFYEDNLDEEFLNFDFNQNPDDDVDGIIQ